MNRREHYAEAERLLAELDTYPVVIEVDGRVTAEMADKLKREAAAAGLGNVVVVTGRVDMTANLLKAQVHATLASVPLDVP